MRQRLAVWSRVVDALRPPPQIPLSDWIEQTTRLAKAAGIGLSTVVDFERQRRRVSAEAVAAMRRALEGKGIQLINGKTPGGEALTTA